IPAVAARFAPADRRADVTWAAATLMVAPPGTFDTAFAALDAVLRVVPAPDARPVSAAALDAAVRGTPAPTVRVLLPAPAPQSHDSVALSQSVVVAFQSHGSTYRVDAVRPAPDRRAVVPCPAVVRVVAPPGVRV